MDKNHHSLSYSFAKFVKNDKTKEAEDVYQQLKTAGFEVLYDDRDISFGKKLKDADLIGICWQVIVSDKQAGLEVIKRSDHSKQNINIKEAIKQFKTFYK